MAALAIIGASLLAVTAGWIPAMIAARQDPAEVMREE
jgi:ABC-type lipoprotein release transport system permease subunit